MGLDIHIITDKDELLYDDQYFVKEEFYKHRLSRTFCNLMNRRNVIDTEPELEQIGRLTSTDITSLYEMESYPHAEHVEFQLMTADSEEEKAKIIKHAEDIKKDIQGNLDRVQLVVDSLITKLNKIDNLSKYLSKSTFDTLDPDEYFADFNTDKGDGYIGNNFGHDLRNFQRFLNFAKSKGAKTVYFNYG